MSGMHRHRLRGLSLQRIVQLLSAALFNGYAIGFQKGRIFTGGSKAVCVPVLNCYSCPGALGACPIGALQAALGGMKRHFPFYVLGMLMLFGVVLGRVVCGLLCPFGLVQDLIHKIPFPKAEVPRRIDRPARYVKYVVLLVLVVLLPAFALTDTGVRPPYFCQYVCPAGTLEGGIPLMLADPMLRGWPGPCSSGRCWCSSGWCCSPCASTAPSAATCAPWGPSTASLTASASSRCAWTRAGAWGAGGARGAAPWRWR